MDVEDSVVVLGGTFSASPAKTSAGVHRLPGINFCSSHPEIARQSNPPAYFTAIVMMAGNGTFRALRLLSRSSGGLLSGPENVTVWTWSAKFD